MNLRIITANHEADPEIGFLSKSILKPYGRAAVKPTAWELKYDSHLTIAWQLAFRQIYTR